MRRSYRTTTRTIVAIALAIGLVAGSAFSQISQDILFKYCIATPDTECFNPASGKVDTVGRDVEALGGGYRFCLPIEEIGGDAGPVQVVIAIDRSQSMTGNNGNDPQDMRAKAAHAFVDSLKEKAPDSYVGSVIFGSGANGYDVSKSMPPVVLNDPTIFDSLWNSLENGATNPQLRKTKDTYQGSAFIAALDMLLALKTSVPGLKQHVIMITDDGWSVGADVLPDELLDEYLPKFPAGEFPQIHTVVISASGNPSQLGLNNIKLIADTTGGMYIYDATPATIASKLSEIFESITVTILNSLESMTVTNLKNSEIRNHTNIKTVKGTDNTIIQYQATIDNLPIAFGLNTIVVKHVEKKSGSNELITKYDTTAIFRTDAWTSTVNENSAEYTINCTEDRTTISIAAAPQSQFVNIPFDVTASINMKSKFLLDTVQVRIFTENSDVDDNATIALFHLDNDLKSSIGKTEGTGSEIQYSAEALFGDFSLKNGFFQFPIGTQSGDFSFETWVKPTSATTAQELFSTTALSLGITATRYLTLSAGGSELATSAVALDAGIWSHVAVSRYNGKMYIFINGMLFSEPAAFTGNVSGALTVKVPKSGQLDEVRASTAARLVGAADGTIRFEVASLQNAAWTLAAASPAGPVMLVSPDKWNAGTLKFKFASPVPGGFVVNIRARGTTTETQWSKNSNPVSVGADRQGPFITNSIFTLGELQAEFDTLDIFFSEPVQCDSLKKSGNLAESFVVYDSTGKKKEDIFAGALFFENSCAETKLITQVRLKLKPNNNGIIPLKDSILLIGATVDTAGNYPDASKRAPIAYGPGSGIHIYLMANEPDRDPMTILVAAANRLGIPKDERGRLIVLTTREVLALPPGGAPGNYAEKSCIYDAVGNLIASEVPLRQSASNKRMYYLVWDGMNKNNRQVSTGAYLFRATVRYAKDVEMNIDRSIQQQIKFSIDRGRKNKF